MSVSKVAGRTEWLGVDESDQRKEKVQVGDSQRRPRLVQGRLLNTRRGVAERAMVVKVW